MRICQLRRFLDSSCSTRSLRSKSSREITRTVEGYFQEYVDPLIFRRSIVKFTMSAAAFTAGASSRDQDHLLIGCSSRYSPVLMSIAQGCGGGRYADPFSIFSGIQ